MLRMISVVLLGFVVNFATVVCGNLVSTRLLGASWTSPTVALLVAYAVVTVAAGAAGAFVTVRTARSDGAGAAAGLAVLILAVGVYLAVAYGPTPGQPTWYPWLLAILPSGAALGTGYTVAGRRR